MRFSLWSNADWKPGPRELQQQLAQQLGVAFVDVDRIKPDLDCLKVVSFQLATKFQVLPLKLSAGKLWVAVPEPNVDLSELETQLKMPLRKALSEPMAFRKELETGSWWKYQ